MAETDSIARVSATIDGNEAVVLAAHVQVGMSEVGTVDCELSDNAGGPDPAAVIGKPFTLTVIRENDGSKLRFAGIVVEAELVGTEGTEPYLRVQAAPRLWRLGRRVGYRVFQEKNVPDIIKDVLTRAGIPETEQEWQVNETPMPRTFVIQHRESEHDFMERLLHEEGIAYVVEEKDGQDVVRFSDTDFGEVEGATSLSYRERGGFHHGSDFAWDLEQAHSVRSGKVTLRDYEFEKPDLQLEKEEVAEGGASTLAVYEFPARTRTDADLGRFTKVLMQAIRADRERITGACGAVHLSPGRKVSIEGHPYEPMNQELLVTRVRYRYRAPDLRRQNVADGGQGLTFEAIPADAKYRPPRRARGHTVPGYDTAVVSGPPGQEIHPDEYGRVKAQFHWDRDGKNDDKSSCYMRTTQLPLEGSLLTPRVNFEVAVACMEADPDEPLIQGRMFNALWPPPYALPAGKTRMSLQTGTTPGGGSVNEVRMEDSAGSEEMFMNASHNMSVSAANNATETVVGNETRTIGNNQTVDVTGAAEVSIGATQNVTVGADQKLVATSYMVSDISGSHSLSIGGDRDVKAGGDHRQSASGATTLDVGGSRIDLVAGSVTEATMAAMTDNIGAALVELTAADRSVAVSGARTESTGAAKIVLSRGGRGTKVGGDLTHNVTGAIVYKTKADLNENADGNLVDVAGAAQVIKADNVTFAAESLLTVVCGASTITLTPGSVTIAGTSITIDSAAPELAALVKDN